MNIRIVPKFDWSTLSTGLLQRFVRQRVRGELTRELQYSLVQLRFEVT